jgi:hypothetical protein
VAEWMCVKCARLLIAVSAESNLGSKKVRGTILGRKKKRGTE